MSDTPMTRDDAAQWLGLPRRTLDDWALRGVGPQYYRVGRHVRYLQHDLDRWLSAQAAIPR